MPHILFDDTLSDRRAYMCRIAAAQGLHISGAEARALDARAIQRISSILLTRSAPRNLAQRASAMYRCAPNPNRGITLLGSNKR